MSQTTTNEISKQTKLTRSSKLFKTIINAIFDKKGENVISLDLRKIDEAVADYFIICEATTNTQVKAIADAIQTDVWNICEEDVFRTEGYKDANWILVDYANVVIHIMQPNARKYYQLEEMWSDAGFTEHTDSPKIVKSTKTIKAK